MINFRDWIKHVCILHYEYYSFWGNGEDKLLSNGVEIPIKSINDQTITLGLESGEVLEGTPSVRLRCTSTNTEASQLTISQTSLGGYHYYKSSGLNNFSSQVSNKLDKC